MLYSLGRKFLTTFTLSIMKSLDIRSESAVKLLSEFLDMDRPYVEGEPHPNAEHFAHGTLSFPLDFIVICSSLLVFLRSRRDALVSKISFS